MIKVPYSNLYSEGNPLDRKTEEAFRRTAVTITSPVLDITILNIMENRGPYTDGHEVRRAFGRLLANGYFQPVSRNGKTYYTPNQQKLELTQP